jgi:hypothetical protein
MGLQDMRQSDHRPVVFQATVRTQLPYINVHAPSRFMGGITCDLCFTDVHVVVEEVEEVIERMNDDFDEMSDVIDPNPKKTKNPLKKMVKKLTKVFKKKNKAKSAGKIRRTLSKRSTGRRKRPQDKRRAASVAEGGGDTTQNASVRMRSSSHNGGNSHWKFSLTSSPWKPGKTQEQREAEDKQNRTLKARKSWSKLHTSIAATAALKSPLAKTQPASGGSAEVGSEASSSFASGWTYTCPNPTQVRLDFLSPALHLGGTSTVVRALNEPAATVPGDLNTVEAQWADGQMPVLVPAVGDVAYVRDQMLLVAVSKKRRGAKSNKWMLAGVASISMAETEEEKRHAPTGAASSSQAKRSSSAAGVAFDSAEGEENAIRVCFGPTDVRLSGVTVGHISGTILVRTIDRSLAAVQRKGSVLGSPRSSSDQASSGGAVNNNNKKKNRSMMMKRLKRQSQHFGSVRGASLLEGAGALAGGSVAETSTADKVADAMDQKRDNFRKKKKGRGSFNWKRVKDQVGESAKKEPAAGRADVADEAIARLMILRLRGGRWAEEGGGGRREEG